VLGAGLENLVSNIGGPSREERSIWTVIASIKCSTGQWREEPRGTTGAARATPVIYRAGDQGVARVRGEPTIVDTQYQK
jgi:hypothetical protein